MTSQSDMDIDNEREASQEAPFTIYHDDNPTNPLYTPEDLDPTLSTRIPREILPDIDEEIRNKLRPDILMLKGLLVGKKSFPCHISNVPNLKFKLLRGDIVLTQGTGISWKRRNPNMRNS